jgi:signal peptidase I
VQTLVRFLVWTAVILGLLLGVLRAVAIRWYWLPSDDPVFEASVSPTLAGGDLIVTARVTHPVFADLVLCPEPDAPNRYIIGRIVGEGGDSIQITNGEVFVNGKTFRSERGCDPWKFTLIDPNTDEEIDQGCYWEDLAGHLHMTGDMRGSKIRPEERQFEVEEGTFFLLSDNRLFPYDSRDYGLVEVDTCKETVIARIVSAKGWMDVARRLDYIQ